MDDGDSGIFGGQFLLAEMLAGGREIDWRETQGDEGEDVSSIVGFLS